MSAGNLTTVPDYGVASYPVSSLKERFLVASPDSRYINT